MSNGGSHWAYRTHFLCAELNHPPHVSGHTEKTFTSIFSSLIVPLNQCCKATLCNNSQKMFDQWKKIHTHRSWWTKPECCLERKTSTVGSSVTRLRWLACACCVQFSCCINFSTALLLACWSSSITECSFKTKSLKDQHSKQLLSLHILMKQYKYQTLADLMHASWKRLSFLLWCWCSNVVLVPTDSVERLLVDPHEGPRLVGLAFVLDAAEFVAKLAVLPLVVVVVFRLPDRLKRPGLVKLDRRREKGPTARLQQTWWS